MVTAYVEKTINQFKRSCIITSTKLCCYWPLQKIPWHTIMLFVCHPKILHKYCLQFLLRVKMARRETENNAYAKFWGDKQRALWYVMVFSGVVNCFGLLICSFLSKLSRRNRHRRTRNFLPGRAVNHLPKKIFQVAQIFTKASRRNEGHITTT